MYTVSTMECDILSRSEDIFGRPPVHSLTTDKKKMRKTSKQSLHAENGLITFKNSQKSKSMKIFVTGGTGFIGSHTCHALLAAGHELKLFVRNKQKAKTK